MDAPVVLVPQDAVDKRGVRLVELTQLDQCWQISAGWLFSHALVNDGARPLPSRFLVFFGRGPWVFHVQLVEHL